MKKAIPIIAVLAAVIAFLGLSLFARAYVKQGFRISSGAMMPTLLVGDLILVDKTISAEKIRKGDVIVFQFSKNPDRSFVKRVIGLPNDTIEIRRKQLFVNGEAVEESYVIHTDDKNEMKDRDNFGPFTVPSRSLFVMGDNCNICICLIGLGCYQAGTGVRSRKVNLQQGG